MTALDFMHDFLSSFGISLTTLLAVVFGIIVVSFFVLREVVSWFVRTTHIREEIETLSESIDELKTQNENILEQFKALKAATIEKANAASTLSSELSLEKTFSLNKRPLDFSELKKETKVVKPSFPLE